MHQVVNLDQQGTCSNFDRQDVSKMGEMCRGSGAYLRRAFSGRVWLSAATRNTPGTARGHEIAAVATRQALSAAGREKERTSGRVETQSADAGGSRCCA